MKGGLLKLLIVVIGLNLFFAYIGNYFLPQSESHPPKTIQIVEGISQEELIAVGEIILFGKGQCMACHPMQVEVGMRAPAMSTIGANIEKEAKERNIQPEQHVFEALVSPMSYIVKPFAPMMPPMHKPPVSLTDGELIALSAFIQSNGGKVTVSYPGSLPILKGEIEKAGGR